MSPLNSEQQRDIQKYNSLVQQLTTEVRTLKERLKAIPAEQQSVERERDKQVEQVRKEADQKKQELRKEETQIKNDLREKERELTKVENDLRELQRGIEQLR